MNCNYNYYICKKHGMKIEILKGFDERVYQFIAPYAMSQKYINANGNPITTSEKHIWYVGFDNEERICCFCSVKRMDSAKSMQIGNLFVVSGGKKCFTSLVKQIIKDIFSEKGLVLRAFANNKNKADFEKLGFRIEKLGVNWHNMKYNDSLRSDTKKA